MKGIIKRFSQIVLSLLICVSTVIPISTSGDNVDLLGEYDTNNLLGVASMFSVFVEDTFGSNGSDCEGRLAAGKGANLSDTTPYYSTLQNINEASVIIGEGSLKNFDVGNRKFVVGSNTSDENILINSHNIYKQDLINFNTEFTYLRRVSSQLSNTISTGTVQINPYWTSEIDFIGYNKDYNIFTLPDYITTDQLYFNFIVPENSYVIVNVPKNNVSLFTQLYGCSIWNNRITSNSDSKSSHILYNLYNAKEFTVSGTGTFYGTILAPNANGSDNMEYGAHNTGSIISKSYTGGIEFGSVLFTGDNSILDKEPVNTVTTTTTTTTTTTATTSTTTLTNTSTATVDTTTKTPTTTIATITSTVTTTSTSTTISTSSLKHTSTTIFTPMSTTTTTTVQIVITSDIITQKTTDTSTTNRTITSTSTTASIGVTNTTMITTALSTTSPINTSVELTTEFITTTKTSEILISSDTSVTTTASNVFPITTTESATSLSITTTFQITNTTTTSTFQTSTNTLTTVPHTGTETPIMLICFLGIAIILVVATRPNKPKR